MKIYGTAKGGAVSKKDFGVAFGGAEKFIEATGGAVTTDDDYKIHKFTSSDDFEVTQIGNSPNNEVEYLVVGGGGGGSSGAGGAGGYRAGTGFEVSVQTYEITVGSGGAGSASTTDSGNGANGGTSTFISELYGKTINFVCICFDCIKKQNKN